ncbi:L-histidine N(alpha)-methyltransferase [Sphingobacterium bambusae]|nr:L-histidine N(alpha)-methyltransferase [Sphingobacterium bambusae]WPL49779.1 L-histidine N(alpha)-methyltransferase [Sphingobacterium bambusae]
MYMRREDLDQNDLSNRSGVFYQDVLSGLREPMKRLPSKYFYDAAGDLLFQKIMRCPEYYLTRCEEEIFRDKAGELLEHLLQANRQVDLIELGAGDASKTQHLIGEMLQQQIHFTYRPIDISPHVLEQLGDRMRTAFPTIDLQAFQGDYFDGLADMATTGALPKVVLFLGANLGNMTRQQAAQFCVRLRSLLHTGDRVLLGIDLMKNPRIIQAAYADEAGLTWQFNMNLLRRMNKELGADFNEELFEHYCQYDPVSGTCSSYLVSLLDHVVHFPDEQVLFEKDELIHMEVSQKYRFEETQALARASGFMPVHAVADKRNWFVDVIWEAC